MKRDAHSTIMEAVTQNCHEMTGISNNIGTATIWSAVLIFPLIPAATTKPSDAATVLIPATINSRVRITMSIHPGINPFSTMRQNAE